MEAQIRKTTELEQEVLQYLNELRESGSINMWLATPLIMEYFDVNRREASNLLMLWMENFENESDYDTVKKSDNG